MRRSYSVSLSRHAKIPFPLRVISAALCPVLLFSGFPSPILFAAPNSQSGSGPLPKTPVLETKVVAEALKPLTPDAALLAQEELKIARLQAPRPAPLIHAPVQGRLPGQFGNTVSDQELQLSAGIVPVPLTPFGETSPEENRALADVLTEFVRGGEAKGTQALEKFTRQWSGSAWRASALANLGQLLLKQGFYAQATEALKLGRQILEATPGELDLQRQLVAGHLTTQLASARAKMGALDELRDLLNETKDSLVPDNLAPLRESLTTASLQARPKEGAERSCGLTALVTLFRAASRRGPAPELFSDSEAQEEVGFVLAEDGGMTLWEMNNLAKAAHLRVAPAKRKAGTEGWPVPSIVHWKWGHFSTILQQGQNSYLIRDRQSGRGRWVSEEVLEEETSGYVFLLLPKVARPDRNPLPEGWESPQGEELKGIRGKGFCVDVNSDDCEECTLGIQDCCCGPAGSGSCFCSPDESCSGCSGEGGSNFQQEDCKECDPSTAGCQGSCQNMPVPSIFLEQAVLTMKDTPVWQSTADGAPLEFTLRYFRDVQSTSIEIGSTNPGRNWVTESVSWLSIGAAHTWGYSCNNHVMGSGYDGQIVVHEAGGGQTTYFANPKYQVHPFECPEPPASAPEPPHAPPELIFLTDPPSETEGKIVPPTGGWDLLAASEPGSWMLVPPTRLQRRLLDGTVEVFGGRAAPADVDANLSATGGANLLLTEIRYPDGKVKKYHYEADVVQGIPLRLHSVEAPTGETMVFGYDAAMPKRIAEVSCFAAGQTTGGRTAYLQYDTLNRLVAITDSGGMTSSFTYYGQSASMTSMTTPYGTWTFSYELDEATGLRAVEMRDPAGGRERVEQRVQAVTGGPTSSEPLAPAGFANTQLDLRNTFYWDKRAMSLVGPEQVPPYANAHIYHWVADGSATGMKPVISSHKPPLRSRIWHEYANSASSSPTKICRLVEPETGSTPVENAWEYEYDNEGKQISVTDPEGRKTWHDFGQVGSHSVVTKIRRETGVGNGDTLSEFSNFTADLLPQTTINAAGQSTTHTYINRKIATTSRLRNGIAEVSRNVYYSVADGAWKAGRLKEARGPGEMLLESYDYDTLGRISSMIDSSGTSTSIIWDDQDKPIRVNYADGTYEQLIYLHLDPIWKRDRAGRWTRLSYDPMRQVTSITDSENRRTVFEMCNCGALETAIDAGGNSISYIYDDAGRVLNKVYSDNRGLTYTYESLSGRVSTVTDAKNQKIVYRYKIDGNIASVRYEDATTGLSLEKSENGLRRNVPSRYIFDAHYPRVTEMIEGTAPNERTTTYTYHPAGELGAGQVMSENGPLPGDVDKVSHDFDELGQEVGLTVGTIPTETFNHNSLGQIETITNVLGDFSIRYAGVDHRRSQVDYPNGIRTKYSYFPSNASAGNGGGEALYEKIENFGLENQAGVRPVLSQFSYRYDVNGKISNWTQIQGGLSSDWIIRYDSVGQLRSLSAPTAPAGEIKEYSYSYDQRGNRLSEQRDREVRASAYNGLNQLIGTTGGAGFLRVEGMLNEKATVSVEGTPAQLFPAAGGAYRWEATVPVSSNTNSLEVIATDVSGNSRHYSVLVDIDGSGSQSFTYDVNGSLISCTASNSSVATTYEWDADKQLISITEGERRSLFEYNARGQRTRQIEQSYDNNAWSTVSDRILIWNRRELRAELNATNLTVEKAYVPQGYAVGPNLGDASARRYYHRDHLGSVREVTGGSGELLARVSYDPWGRPQRRPINGAGDLGTEVVPHGFTGHYLHVGSGLHLAFHRAYDANLARWISRDPKGEEDGPNLYSYVKNSAATYVDPAGLNAACEAEAKKLLASCKKTVKENFESEMKATRKMHEDIIYELGKTKANLMEACEIGWKGESELGLLACKSEVEFRMGIQEAAAWGAWRATAATLLAARVVGAALCNQQYEGALRGCRQCPRQLPPYSDFPDGVDVE